MNLKSAHMEQMAILLASSPHWIIQALGTLDKKRIELPGRNSGKEPEEGPDIRPGRGGVAACTRKTRRPLR